MNVELITFSYWLLWPAFLLVDRRAALKLPFVFSAEFKAPKFFLPALFCFLMITFGFCLLEPACFAWLTPTSSAP